MKTAISNLNPRPQSCTCHCALLRQSASRRQEGIPDSGNLFATSAAKLPRFLFIVTLILFWIPAFPQDYKHDFAAANRFLYQSKKMSFRVDVKIYRSPEDIGMISSTAFKKNHRGSRYEKAFNIEKVINEKSFLLVDHHAKTIMTGENVKTLKAEPLPDSLKYDNGDSVIFNELKNGKLFYTVYNKHIPGTLKTEIILNAKTFAMEQVDYYYDLSRAVADPAYKISLVYNYSPDDIDDDVLDFSHYIIKNKEGYIPAQKYKGYKVITL